MPNAPKAKFTTLGKSKFVHVVRSKAFDLKPREKGGSGCQQVRKYTVAGNVNYKSTISPEAALALENCAHCETHDVATALLPKPSKADRKQESDDFRERFAKEAAGKGKTKPKKVAKAKAVKEPKAPKQPKDRKPPKPTKSGPRSVVPSGTADPAKAKAEMLSAFGDEHGWKSKIEKDGNTGHWVLVSTRDDETIYTYFIDGKYDIARHAEVIVGTWTGKLRGAHGVRRQMSGEGRDRPHPSPGTGRSGPRKSKAEVEAEADEHESPEDARKRVPFSLDDDPVAIIDAIKGRTIRWRSNAVDGGMMDSAWLPAEAKGKKRDKIEIVDHPKTGKRILRFFTVVSITEHGEQYGPERSVYLDKIVRVVE